jgi:hypothetical protein
MTHPEFVAAFRARQISVRGNESLALQIMNGNLMPMHYRASHAFWTWVWFLMFPAAIALGIWFRWWAGVLCFLATGPVKAGFKKSACEFILEHAIENEGFYNIVSKAGMFHIEPAQPTKAAA